MTLPPPSPPSGDAAPTRRRVSFTNVRLPDSPAPAITPLADVALDKVGNEIAYDLSEFAVTGVTTAVAAALRTYIRGRDFGESSPGTAARSNVLGPLILFLRGIGEAIQGGSLAALRREDVARGLAAVVDGATPAMQRRNGNSVLALLKGAGPESWDPDAWRRLQRLFARRGANGHRSVPREPYTYAEADAIRRVCRARIDAVIARLREGEVLLATGTDPRGGPPEAWSKVENLVRLAREVGPLTHQHFVGWGLSPRWADGICGGLVRLNGYLYPTGADLFPFYVLFQLETGVPPVYAARTARDAMQRVGRGRFTLTYVKKRAQHKALRRRYTDGNLGTPGGIIRAVLALTKNSASHAPNLDALFLIRREGWTSERGPFGRLAHHFDHAQVRLLAAEAGLSRKITLARLRKTWKAQQTKESYGQLTEIAADHTLPVHLDHYARVKALVPVHRQIFHEMLIERRRVVTRSAVLTPAEEQAAKADPAPLARRLGKPLPVVQDAVDGKLDLWLAACVGYTESPFAPAGQPCPGAPLGWCLDCPNGVIAPSKLPAIWAYLHHLVEQRRTVLPDQWRAVFGDTYRKLVFGVLARYPDSVLRETRLLAEQQIAMPYLGPELRPWSHL